MRRVSSIVFVSDDIVNQLRMSHHFQTNLMLRFAWKFTYESYGGESVSQINWSFLNDWFCGCKWLKTETNFEHQSVYKTSRSSQRRFDQLQLTIFDVDMGFKV